MEKIYGIVTDKQFDNLVESLIGEFGLPEIRRKLSVYAYSSNKNQLHINFIDQRCDIKYVDDSKNKTSVPPIFVENKNLRQLFSMVDALGFQKANVGFIISLNFKIEEDLKVSLSQDTFADNIAEIKFNPANRKSVKKVKKIFKSIGIELIDRSELKIILDKKTYELEDVFDKFGFLNSKIRKYGEMVGIDVLSNTRSLRSRLKKFSNDYSIYEEWFEKITGGHLNGSVQVRDSCTSFFKPISIVIPCFNSDGTILKTLTSVESQNLTIDQKQKIEVVVVDDGSDNPVQNIVAKGRNNFNFNLKIIRLETNSGLSVARNVGIFNSMHEHIVLLDSDIVLPQNYLLEHSVRNQLIPHAVFVSLKKNIDDSSEIAKLNKIKQGLSSPQKVDDLRAAKSVSNSQLGIHKFNEDTTLQILDDTNYFKAFGFGRTMGVFDLATMVIGHNISTRRKTLEKCKYFSSIFRGWGLEDSYFGAKLIANGNYVIPVLSSNVFHINHPPRSGSEKQKNIEFEKNIEVYNDLLDKDFE